MLVTQSPDRNILLGVMDWDTEKIDIFYSDSSDANNMDFSFVTNVLIPNPAGAARQPPIGPLVNRRSGRSYYSLNFPLMGLNLLRLHLMACCLFGMFEVKFPQWC